MSILSFVVEYTSYPLLLYSIAVSDWTKKIWIPISIHPYRTYCETARVFTRVVLLKGIVRRNKRQSSGKNEAYIKDHTYVFVTMRAVGEVVPGTIPGRIDLGNELFRTGSSLGVVVSVPNWISLLWTDSTGNSQFVSNQMFINKEQLLEYLSYLLVSVSVRNLPYK